MAKTQTKPKVPPPPESSVSSGRPDVYVRDNTLDRELLLQAHIAEFETITARNTHWLTLQYALLPILGAAFAVLAQMWNQFDQDPAISTQAHRIIIWLAIVFVNVTIIAHTEVGWESYNNVVYLENCLREEIVALVPGSDPARVGKVLGYEKYLRDQRGKGPKWWEVPGFFVSSGLLIGGVALFGVLYPWTPVEWVAVPVNAVLSVMVLKVTIKMIRKRREIGARVAVNI